MILTSDLHLTDRDRDEYRWDFFLWLAKRQKPTDTLCVLGDLCDAKDGHSARLVNRIIDTLLDMPGPVVVLKGNHDYIDEDCPFFRFLGRKEFGTKLRFISQPERIFPHTLALPHTRNPNRDWKDLDLKGLRLILTHQTYNGADAGGHTLESNLSSKYWSEVGFKGTVLSGDIHVPQEIGDVMYVGCPYPVHFGDKFKPRILELESHTNRHWDITSVPVPSIRRLTLDLDDVEELLEEKLNPGDQLKVRVHLQRHEYPNWDQHRARLQRIALDRHVYLFSVELHERETVARKKRKDRAIAAPTSSDPRALLRQFCEARGYDETVEDVASELIPKRPS